MDLSGDEIWSTLLISKRSVQEVVVVVVTDKEVKGISPPPLFVISNRRIHTSDPCNFHNGVTTRQR